MKRSPLNSNQTRNARYILERAQQAELSKDDAYAAAWFAFAESSLGENLKGQGTIGGMYHYSQGAWKERETTYRYKEKARQDYPQFDDFKWESNKDQASAQVTVLLADLQRYRGEFNRLSNGADPETVFKGNAQGLKAWKRFIDPANDVPFSFEDYAYLRHNTSVNQTKRVGDLRTNDGDGAYGAIRNEADVVYNPSYEPGIFNENPVSSGAITPLQGVLDVDDEDQYFGPSPGM